jgi:hypothetical protein
MARSVAPAALRLIEKVCRSGEAMPSPPKLALLGRIVFERHATSRALEYADR